MIDLAAVRRRAENLASAIRGYRRGSVRVRDFRLNYGEGRTATLGIHDSNIGGVYSPFQLSDGVRGSFFIAWQDGRVSRGVVDGNVADGAHGPDLSTLLSASYDAAYEDPDARFFAGPARVLPIPIYDERVGAILDGRFELLYDIVDLIRARGLALGVRKISGNALASVAASVILSSRGLRYAALSSECSFAFGYDSELWDGRARRRPFTLAEVRRRIDRAEILLRHLRTEDRKAHSGQARVVFLPGFAAEMMDSFVLGNLYGSEVVTGQSAFRPEDFRKRKQVFREDFSLRIDPRVPYSSGSYRITSEGLPARHLWCIRNGRLQRPIVGHKYARRLKMKPTTPPTGMESVWFEAGGALSEKGACSRMGEGFAVLSALGLHTQDHASGDYSLTAPRALVVRGGRMVGVTKAVLAGNFLEHLRAADTRLVKVAGTRFPGLLVTTHVTVG